MTGPQSTTLEPATQYYQPATHERRMYASGQEFAYEAWKSICEKTLDAFPDDAGDREYVRTMAIGVLMWCAIERGNHDDYANILRKLLADTIEAWREQKLAESEQRSDHQRIASRFNSNNRGMHRLGDGETRVEKFKRRSAGDALKSVATEREEEPGTPDF